MRKNRQRAPSACLPAFLFGFLVFHSGGFGRVPDATHTHTTRTPTNELSRQKLGKGGIQSSIYQGRRARLQRRAGARARRTNGSTDVQNSFRLPLLLLLLQRYCHRTTRTNTYRATIHRHDALVIASALTRLGVGGEKFQSFAVSPPRRRPYTMATEDGRGVEENERVRRSDFSDGGGDHDNEPPATIIIIQLYYFYCRRSTTVRA